MSGRRPHVLVMPEQMPRHPGDLAGVFSLDYIAAIGEHCRVTVLVRGYEGRSGVAVQAAGSDGAEYVTWTPRLRGSGSTRERLGRLEVLYQLGRQQTLFPTVDLIHAHGPIFHGAAAATLGRKLNVPVVVTVHTGPFSKLLDKVTRRWLTRRTLQRVDCVCPVSYDLQRQIEEAGIRPRRFEVTYNPVDTELFRPGRRSGPNRRIVFAGRLEEYKGGLRVIRAFADIAERWAGWTLSIAGEGPERPLIEKYLGEHPAMRDRVELLGFQTRPQLARLFSAADCLVFPSRHETFGLVLAEAMSAGLPVIGPDRTAPPEFIDESCGLLVPPDDVNAIADGMDRLLQRLPGYNRDGIRDAVVRRFGLAAFGERLHALYEELLRTRTREG